MIQNVETLSTIFKDCRLKSQKSVALNLLLANQIYLVEILRWHIWHVPATIYKNPREREKERESCAFTCLTSPLNLDFWNINPMEQCVIWNTLPADKKTNTQILAYLRNRVWSNSLLWYFIYPPIESPNCSIFGIMLPTCGNLKQAN